MAVLRRRRWIVLSVIVLIHSVMPRLEAADPPSAPLLAGAATANITPPLGTLIVGGWVPAPAMDVHDELHVRALVLNDGTTRLAFAVCDNVGIPREVFDRAKHRIEESIGIPAHCVMTSATHTHSGGSARTPNSMIPAEKLDPYPEFIAERIADAVRMAAHRCVPAKIGWGSVDEPSHVFNRRWYVAEESERHNPFGGIDIVRMNPGGNSTLIRPAGPVDPEISFVAVKSLKDQPIAVLANYSLHYVGGVTDRTISADYFAYFAKHLSHLLGVEEQSPPFVGILSNGTSGDVNNINFREREKGLPPFEKMRIVGESVATRVHTAMQSIEYRERVALQAVARELPLRVRKPDAKLLAYMEQVRKRPTEEKPFQTHEKIYADRVQQLVEAPDEVRVVLQAFAIDQLGIAAIPFEVFTEIGLELKEKSPLHPMFTIELANGSYGYLPTPSQHDLGGYETWMGTNKVERDSSTRIVDELLSMMRELHTKSPRPTVERE